MAAQLVIEETADQFAFRHALTQQAIYAELLVRERQALHQTIAKTLEQLSAFPSFRERHLVDLASHCYEAGMWEKAMVYEQQVGEQALTLYAQRAAIDHLTRAVDAAHHLSLTPSSQVYRARGQAYDTIVEFDRARGDYERALDAARTAHDGGMEWQSVMALGFLWTGRDYEQAGAWFRQALDLAERLADPTLRARSLNRLGNWLGNTGRDEEGLRAHQEALSIFETQQDTRGMAETLDLLGTARQARRVVKAGGYVAMVSWGRAEDCEHFATFAAVMACVPPPPPGAEGPFSLSEPGKIEALMVEAGLTPRASGNVSCPFEYPDDETAWKAISSPGPLVGAIQYAGEDKIKQAILDSLVPYKTRNGGYRQENSFRYVIATA